MKDNKACFEHVCAVSVDYQDIFFNSNNLPRNNFL